jgi:hypothetical protein
LLYVLMHIHMAVVLSSRGRASVCVAAACSDGCGGAGPEGSKAAAGEMSLKQSILCRPIVTTRVNEAYVRSTDQAAELLAGHPLLSRMDIVQLLHRWILTVWRPFRTCATSSRYNYFPPRLTLAALPQPQTLEMHDIDIIDWDLISSFVGLQELAVWGCAGADDLRPLIKLTYRYEQQLDLRSISRLIELKSLNLRDNHRMTSLSQHISTLTGLHILNLYNCLRVSSLTPLTTLTGLAKLDMALCRAVTSLEALSTLTGLHTLNMRSCVRVTSLTPLSTLSSLSSLTSLNMSVCIAVTSLDGLGSLTGLINLGIGYCRAVSSLTPLSSLTRLCSLTWSGCNAAGALPPSLDHLLGVMLASAAGLLAVTLWFRWLFGVIVK